MAAHFGLDSRRQGLVVPLLVGTAHVGHVVAVPMEADDARDEEMIVRAGAGHCVFEELRCVHILIHALAELEEERVFHVAGEFLFAHHPSAFFCIIPPWCGRGEGWFRSLPS